MSLLVFGRTGQVARAIAAREPGARLLDRDAADLSDPAACAAAIARQAPQAVINAAAFTGVDAAEDDESTATAINAAAPGAMARICADLGIPFVQISTDYVFDGAGQMPFAPDAAPAPLGVYGRSKLAGERAVIAAAGVHGILRTSWVFSAHGTNFVKTMLRLGAERHRLSVVDDQIGGPTPAVAVADACLLIARTLRDRPDLSGIYHLSGAPDISWAGFAAAIMAEAGLACWIDPITSADYPQKAPRPVNSRLDCTTLHTAFGLGRPEWRHGLTDVIEDLKVPLS